MTRERGKSWIARIYLEVLLKDPRFTWNPGLAHQKFLGAEFSECWVDDMLEESLPKKEVVFIPRGKEKPAKPYYRQNERY